MSVIHGIKSVKKRFTNFKDAIMQVTPMEKKVKDATSNESWGPTVTVKKELAEATKNYVLFKEIMGMLWRRMGETPANYKIIQKSLNLLKYLLVHGSENVMTEAKLELHNLKKLCHFDYTDDNGNEVGNSIRNLAQDITKMVRDESHFRKLRKTKRKTVNRYQGFSKDEIRWKGEFNGGGNDSGKRYKSNRSDDSGSEEDSKSNITIKRKRKKKKEKKKKKIRRPSFSEKEDEVPKPTRKSERRKKKKTQKVEKVVEKEESILNFFEEPTTTTTPAKVSKSKPTGNNEDEWFGDDDQWPEFEEKKQPVPVVQKKAMRPIQHAKTVSVDDIFGLNEDAPVMNVTEDLKDAFDDDDFGQVEKVGKPDEEKKKGDNELLNFLEGDSFFNPQSEEKKEEEKKKDAKKRTINQLRSFKKKSSSRTTITGNPTPFGGQQNYYSSPPPNTGGYPPRQQPPPGYGYGQPYQSPPGYTQPQPKTQKKDPFDNWFK